MPTAGSHPEEPSDLEELEQFARTFKQRRIKLGFTQVGSAALLPFALDVPPSAFFFFFFFCCLNRSASTRET